MVTVPVVAIATEVQIYFLYLHIVVPRPKNDTMTTL